MKWILLTVAMLSFGCSTLSSKSGFKMREYSEYRLKNGLKVLLVKDDSLPYFSLNLLIGSGAGAVDRDQAGLANFVGELLKKGTRSKSALEIADELGQIGAEFNVSVTEDYTYLSASSLSFDKEKLMQLYTDILLKPAFSPEETKRLKEIIVAGIQNQVDHPDYFASQVFNSFLYEEHPYAQPVIGTGKAIKAIRQKDINRFYLRYYRPDNAALAVVGKFEPEEVKKLVEMRFGGWEKADVEGREYPPFPKITGKEILLVDKPGLTQAQIRMGFQGIKRQNEDYLTLRLANTILGGAFASRLSDEIRRKRGLTYHIGSQIDPLKETGAFYVSTFTRNEKVHEAVSETLNLLQAFYDKGVTAEEVEQAKGLMAGTFPRAIETAERFADNLLVLRFYGVSDDYLANFIRDVKDVSVAEVNRVVKKYLNPENIKILVYSDKSQVEAQLKEVGDVEVTDFHSVQNQSFLTFK